MLRSAGFSASVGPWLSEQSSLTYLHILSVNNCTVPLGFPPQETWVAFPGESQLWQNHATQPTVHAGCFSVSIIHQTLMWTTRFLICAQTLTMHAIAHVGSTAQKVDSERLAAMGNQTCVSGMPVPHSTNRATPLPCSHIICVGLCREKDDKNDLLNWCTHAVSASPSKFSCFGEWLKWPCHEELSFILLTPHVDNITLPSHRQWWVLENYLEYCDVHQTLWILSKCS